MKKTLTSNSSNARIGTQGELIFKAHNSISYLLLKYGYYRILYNMLEEKKVSIYILITPTNIKTDYKLYMNTTHYIFYISRLLKQINIPIPINTIKVTNSIINKKQALKFTLTY